MSSKRKPEKKYGKWFLQSEGVSISGCLIIDEDAFSQTLILYSKSDFNGVKIDINDNSFRNIKTIYGEVNSRTSITLQNCSYRGLSLIGDELWEIKFILELSFLGGHLTEPDETTYYEVRCSYPYLSSWYDTNRNYFGSLYECSDLDRMRPSLGTGDLIDEIQIDDDLTIQVERLYSQNSMVMDKEVSIQVRHYVNFRTSSPRTFREFRKMAYRFSQLIQLATGKLIFLDFVSVVGNPKDIKNVHYQFQTREEFPYLEITFMNKDQKRNYQESDYIHQNMMLFYGGENRRDQLNQTIAAWYRSYNKYSSIYNRFLDTFEWFQNTDATLSQVMFDNRFLNLIQALESFHVISFPEFEKDKRIDDQKRVDLLLSSITDSEDKQWLAKKISLHTPLRKRLDDLMEKRLLSITSEIFKDRKQRKGFIEKVKTARDDLSHGNELDIEPIKIGEYYEKALIMLVSCVLISLGFTEEQTRTSLFRTFKYQNTIGYLKSKF